MSNASISLVLASSIIYMMVRCTIEYTMQPTEVRQWRVAQFDFSLSLFLVRAALLMLAAGGLNRSVDTVVYVAIGALILMGGSILLLILGMMALMPLLMRIRARQGRFSVASRAIESLAWSQLITLVLISGLLVALGVASLEYEPLRSLWTAPPRPIAVAVFVTTAIAVFVSLNVGDYWKPELFLYPQSKIKIMTLPDGANGVSFREARNVEQDKSQSSRDGSSNAPKSGNDPGQFS